MLRSDLYKAPRAHERTPRPGDLAELYRDHCQPETGLLVQVIGEPHLAEVNCSKCGQKVVEYIVEVHSDNPAWQNTPGPWFHPIAWLKRIDPMDPVQYARVRNYEPLAVTTEQLIAANR